MYQHDSSLDDLLRRPMQMATNDDDYEYEYEDDEYDEEEDDLFGSDVLEAAKAERQAEEQAAEAFAASLLGGHPENEAEEEVLAAPEPPPEQSKLFLRSGIRRNIFGYGGIIFAGLVSLSLLVLFGLRAGLSSVMWLFTLGLVVGLALSVYHLVFIASNYDQFTVGLNVRRFFRFVPELVTVSVVLLGITFWNISGMANGNPFTLSGKPIGADKVSRLFEENQEETVFSSFKQAQINKENAQDTIGGSVAAAGAQQGNNLNTLVKEPVAGAAAASIVNTLPADAIPAAPTETSSESPLRNDDPLINSAFLGGALCAALGYAFIVGIAGALFGLLRQFDTPFSETKQEIFNIETGEVTTNVQNKAPIMKPVDLIYRAFVGLFYGSSVGFLLGAAVILPLNMLFSGLLTNDNVRPLLQSLGLSNIPDLAFSNGLTVAGIMVPLVLIMVAKLSPQGMSMSESVILDQYVIKPTGRFVPADQLVGGNLPNPSIVNFGGMGMIIPDDELETELANDRLMDELAMEDDNLTSEIIEEFGRDFESVFGIDTRELMTQPKGGRQSTFVDRKQLANALDESFGELGNVPVEVSAELGQATLDITEWLNLKEGTLVLLDKPADEEIDILFNGVRKGKGQLIVSEDSLAVQVSNTNFQRQNGNGSGAII
jgi:flagellar motor switch/type III secretory pathway protein FliN